MQNPTNADTKLIEILSASCCLKRQLLRDTNSRSKALHRVDPAWFKLGQRENTLFVLRAIGFHVQCKIHIKTLLTMNICLQGRQQAIQLCAL